MELKDLVGEHLLSGFEHGDEKYNYDDSYEDEREYCLFILDNVTYLASEDPNDGYRSYCNELEITDRKVKNTFKPIEVICKMAKYDDSYEDNDVLEIYDMYNKKLILAIGTRSYDGYYPWYECEYHPENMSINENIIDVKYYN